MSKTFSELLADARDEVALVSLEALAARLEQPAPPVIVDVREQDEVRSGMIPGAIHIPRGFLEVRAEELLPDRDAEIVVYCAAGIRSVLAARTLAELGYTRVSSADPGFMRWRDLELPVEVPPSFTDQQRERYSRHLLVPEIGELGQARLLASRVLLLGAGGLGSPAALYLAAAGVGTLGLVDADHVELSNLQRQVIHATSRLGRAKVDSAESVLGDLNPDVRVLKYPERLTRENVDRVFGVGWDVIVDGCDNFPTRYLVNDASLVHRIPVVHGSIFRFDGQVTTFAPSAPWSGPCYRCLYPEPPPPELAPSCVEAGVLGVLPGTIGLLQATEALKLLLGRGEPLVGRLLAYDALAMTFRTLRFSKEPRCPACGEPRARDGYPDYEGFCRGGAAHV